MGVAREWVSDDRVVAYAILYQSGGRLTLSLLIQEIYILSPSLAWGGEGDRRQCV